MDDLEQRSQSLDGHVTRLPDVSERLETAGFTLDREKPHLEKKEIKLLWHSPSAEAVQVPAEGL
jgi:hypothetical protein